MRPKTTAASRYTAGRWYSSREISSPAPASTSLTARAQSSKLPTLPLTTMTPRARAVAWAASSLPE